MRYPLIAAALVALSACSPSVPDSGAGVGFGDYDEYLRAKAAREAQLRGDPTPAAGAVSDETLGAAQQSLPQSRTVETSAATSTSTSTATQTTATAATAGTAGTATASRGDGTDIAAETAALLAERQANSGQAVVHASPSNPTPQTVLKPGGISNENDFLAVGAQRSIEGDAALLAANKQQYKVVETQALPTRSGGGGPNIVDYALRANHPVGTKLYNRIGIGLAAKAARNCAKYASPDLAQTEFLEKGGPQRDRLRLDPDGDGYACSWDPAPFRRAVSG